MIFINAMLLLFIIYNHKQLYYSHFFNYFKEFRWVVQSTFCWFEIETVVSRVFSLHEEFQVLSAELTETGLQIKDEKKNEELQK